MALLPIDFANPFPSLPTIQSLPTMTVNQPASPPLSLPSIFGNQTATGLPRTAEQAGALALLGYAMRPQKDITSPSIYDMRSPYGTSAANYLQGAFQSPADPFAPGGTYSGYLPLLQQQENELLNNAQQRIIAGQPGSLSTAMGGSEIESIRSGIANYLLPQRYKLFADLQRENLARQMAAAGTLYAGEGDLQQSAFEAEINAALANARSESERNAILGALGTALLLSGRGSGGTAAGGIPGVPGASQPGTGTQGGGGLGDAISRWLGGGTGNQGQYAPIGQMSVQDILGQMQAGTLSATEGLALLARTQALPLAGTALAGYGAGNLVGGWAGGATDSQLVGAGAGGLGGAAAGAAVGSAIFPGVGTAIGAVVGGIAGLFGGLGETREQQHEVKEAFRQADLDSQADMVQEVGSFFTQQLGQLGIDTSAFQQFVGQMVAASPGGAGSYSFGGYGATGDQQESLAQIGGQVLLSAVRQANPAITSLSQVPGLRQEFIDYLTRSTFVPPNPGMSEGRPITYQEGLNLALPAGLQRGGSLPAGGEFIVGERGPELLRAAPGSEVLPMLRGADGTFGFDPTATARSVVPPNIFLPDVSRSFEGLPAPYPISSSQALIGQLDPQMLMPGARPQQFRRAPPRIQPFGAGVPTFAGTHPLGQYGNSLLARALQVGRTQQSRRRYAPTHA